MPIHLDGANVVITGAARGIGRAMAARFLAEGARVIVNDVDAEALAETAATIGAIPVPGDAASAVGVAALLAQARAKLGSIDVFCANAGIETGGGVGTEESWARTWEVNVMAHVRAFEQLAPEWLERGQGRFIATVSAAGLLSMPGSAPYAVTKHAALAFAEWMAITYADRGIVVPLGEKQADGSIIRDAHVETSAYARTLAADAVDADGNVIIERGHDLGDPAIAALLEAGIDSVKVRSVLTCDTGTGVCAHCYGRSMATGKLVDIGEAVGIIAAQSIGEPGTQLTMRTFHTGGVAGDDITQGLPRVVELFEARTPKGVAPVAEATGRVRIEDSDKARRVVLVPDDGSDEHSYPVSKRARLLVEEGQHIEVGSQLVVGAVDPKQVLRILGPRKVQMHLVDEVQSVYRQQGVSIHDKHIEVIVRQMLRRITILESGDADLLPGRLVDCSATFSSHGSSTLFTASRS